MPLEMFFSLIMIATSAYTEAARPEIITACGTPVEVGIAQTVQHRDAIEREQLEIAWSQEAWCDGLAQQVSFLLLQAHAPVLAARASCSLEQCSGQSQETFRQILAARQKTPGQEQIVDGEDVFEPLQDSFALVRARQAQQYLASPQRGVLPACSCLAEALTEATASVAHERLFLKFLACTAKAER